MESLKKDTFNVVSQKYIKITLFLERRALFCQILQRAVSDYQTLISFGLFLNYVNKEILKLVSTVFYQIFTFHHMIALQKL